MSLTVNHITLNVTDLERSRAFYAGVLGLTIDQDLPGEKLRFRLDGTATRIVLKPALPGTPGQRPVGVLRGGRVTPVPLWPIGFRPMVRRSMAIGSIVVVLATGGCSGDDRDPPAGNTSGSTAPLCERIGTDPLRKVIPSFEPDPPGAGESDACVRLAGGSAEAPVGDFLRITIEDPSPGTDEECRNLERDRGEATWMPPDHLGGVGEFACGTVLSGADKGVVVTILSRRGGTHVSISYGRTPGEVTTVREAVIDLARTVMRRV